MNWYRTLKYSQETIQNHGLEYMDIGHFSENAPVTESPNFMWIFYGGDILTIKETNKNPSHYEAFDYLPDGVLDNIYVGRFESGSGKLSIAKPRKGISQFRPIPEIIIKKLYNKFSIKEVYEF